MPPTGAKGLNLAIADVRVLSRAIVRSYFKSGSTEGLDGYSAGGTAADMERAAFFLVDDVAAASFPERERRFDRRRQIAELEYLVCSSRAASTTLAENYAGLPID